MSFAEAPQQARPHLVEVYSLGVMLRGWTSTRRRVSDHINEKDEFLVLSDVEIWRYGTPRESLEQHTGGMVTKTAIEIMAESDDPAPSAPGEQHFGLHVPKVPHQVILHTTNFAIHGEFHLAQTVNLDTTLSLFKDAFLPITNANITPNQQTRAFDWFHRRFLLINRAQVSYIGSAAQPPPISF
jgi:hypothetical protein